MAHVTVTINGRQYRLACEAGQEGQVAKAAQALELRITELRLALGEVGDDRLLIMAALSFAAQAAKYRDALAKR